MNNKYYTYAYLREDRTPYYVGKGKGRRIYQRHQNGISVPKDRTKIIFLKQNLSEEEAFKHEIYMIAVFGRIDLGTGILRNKTNGGEGGSGRVLTEEHKRKISEGNKDKLKGKSLSEKTKKKIKLASKGRKFSEQTRKKISEALKNNTNGSNTKGIKRSPEVCEALSAERTKPDNQVSSHALYMRKYRKERPKYSNEEWKSIRRRRQIEKQTKTYQITFDNGRSIIVNGLRKFAKENGYSSNIFNVMNGTSKIHKDIVAVEQLSTPAP